MVCFYGRSLVTTANWFFAQLSVMCWHNISSYQWRDIRKKNIIALKTGLDMNKEAAHVQRNTLSTFTNKFSFLTSWSALAVWSMCVFPWKAGPTLDFQVGWGLGGGDLVSVLSNVSGLSDDDNEASDSTVHLAQHVLVEVNRLTVF